MRNIFAVAAITLTCLLFTALFSMGMSIAELIQNQTMEEVGTRAHAGLKNVTMEQYEKISKYPSVVSSTWNIYLGTAENFSKRQAEIRVAKNEEELDHSFASLKEGRLPRRKDDLVTDTIILKELEIPAEIGEKVHVEFTFHGEKISRDFTLCGWYEGSEVNHASTLYVSEDYWESLRGDASWEELLRWDRNHPENNHAGLVSGNIFFKNSRNIEENIRKIIENAGYIPEDSGQPADENTILYGVNWAYMSSRAESVDPLTAALLCFIFAVILITGYLIIYNIFQISIVGDIRFYGQLKTIGATKRQLRRIVYRQALLLCIPGIPAGLLFGIAAGKLLLPLALRTIQGTETGEISLNPWILVFGAAFSLLTVCISSRRPARIAGNVSPVEAVRFSENDRIKKKEKKSQKSAGIRRMALANLGRNRRKTAVVISSISLGIILLEIVMSAVGSFRIEEYLTSRIAGDFEIGNAGLFNVGSLVADFEIDGEYLEGADSQPGIEQTGEVWWGNIVPHELSDNAYGRYKELLSEGKLRADEYMEEQSKPENIAKYRLDIEEMRYGYTDNLLKNLTPVKGEINLEKFAQGGYVLVQQQTADQMEKGDTLYEPGDKITLQYRTPQSEYYEKTDGAGIKLSGYTNMDAREYTVMAVIEDIPYSMSTPFQNINGLTTVVPLQDLKNAYGAMMIAKTYEVDQKDQEAFEEYLEFYTTQQNTEMDYVSRQKLADEFYGMIQSISVIGYALCAVIALIGILNFTNSMLTGIIARKQEFAVLQSVGMTKRQLRSMLLWESAYYLLICAAVSIPAGSLLAWKLIGVLNDVILCFDYRYTGLPYLIMLPAVTFAAAAVSLGACRQVGKRSIVESLREAE